MKSGELVYQRPSERATTLRNYNKRNFQLSRKAPIPSRVPSPNSPEGAGPASDHLHRLHEKMQAVEGLRSESPAPTHGNVPTRRHPLPYLAKINGPEE
jgi:hypothetical protein